MKWLDAVLQSKSFLPHAARETEIEAMKVIFDGKKTNGIIKNKLTNVVKTLSMRDAFKFNDWEAGK